MQEDKAATEAAQELGRRGGLAKWAKITDPNKRSRIMSAVRKAGKRRKTLSRKG